MQRGLYYLDVGIVPPQYAIFELVGAPSVLFNFNLDGLARMFLGHRHLVLHPHGEIDREYIEVLDYEELRDDVVSFSLQLAAIRPKLLPGPEPLTITSGLPYRLGRDRFADAPAIIVIGYSFGKGERAFDDNESFEYFMDLLRRFRRPIFILSPEPAELAGLIRETVKSREVYEVPVFWNVFGRVLYLRARERGDLAGCLERGQVDRLLCHYLQTLDESGDA